MITLIVLLKHYQNRDKKNTDKTEATGNTYKHTKTNRNTHRQKHRHTHTCKHKNIKIFKHHKKKTNSQKQIYKTHWEINISMNK